MPQVGKKKYPYTKKGKAAAAKARQKQKRRGPMPKVNPEFAKEMEEANRTRPAEPEAEVSHVTNSKSGRPVVTVTISESQAPIRVGMNRYEEGSVNLDKARKRGKEAAKRRTQRRAKKGRTSSRDPQSRHFRGIGKKAKRT